jgi:hypothetical protein
MRVSARRTALTSAGLIALAIAPARADGTLGLGEVIAAVAKAPKLVTEIQGELGRSNLKAEGVTCMGARHGNHWTYLGGALSMRDRRPHADDRGRPGLFRQPRKAAGRPRQRQPEAGKDLSGEQFSLDLGTMISRTQRVF